jgi:hypothetical protein
MLLAMAPIPELPLPQEPSVAQVLAAWTRGLGAPTTLELIHYDRFARLFCSCGRHTYGTQEPEKFLAKEQFTVPWPEGFERLFDVYKASMWREEAIFQRHTQAGRTAPVCRDCACTRTSHIVNTTRLAHAQHHHVLDLTRSCLDRTKDETDQYVVPAKPLWQGAALCERLLPLYMHLSDYHYLIQRRDGLWVYVEGYNCSATPDYRCDTNVVKIYWSDDVAWLWNQCMTAEVRQEFWKHLAYTRNECA